jgi:hypothetical protein
MLGVLHTLPRVRLRVPVALSCCDSFFPRSLPGSAKFPVIGRDKLLENCSQVFANLRVLRIPFRLFLLGDGI